MHIHKPLRTLKYGLKSSILWKYDFVKQNYRYLIEVISMKKQKYISISFKQKI